MKSFIKSFTIFVCFFFIAHISKGVTIVNFPLTSTNEPSVYSSGNNGCRFVASGNRTLSYDQNTGISTTEWGIGTYWQTTAINATDFYTITVTGQVSSEDVLGPRDFKLQWSIDNSNWNDVSNLLEFTSTTTSFTPINLPVECAFQSTLYVRFSNYTNTSTDGLEDGIDIDANSFFKGLVIAGEELAPPTTQASNITLVAITPTSIKLDCSSGSGTNRIIVMNTSNTFSTPANDYNPISNTNYISGEQVIYNGTGNSVTVIVPSSKNEYWFRVYDYNLFTGKIRYNTATNVENPKQCLLENVILPTVTDIRLTTAYLGGSITDPPSGTITQRGIYWSISPGVSVNSNKVIEGNAGTGVFSFKVTGLPRSTSIIYFKAYVNNLSGTALSEEASFSNIPIFTGNGNWEDPTRWNVMEVPGLANSPTGSQTDSPIINGTCTVAASQTTVRLLRINTGHSLSINPGQAITTTSTLTNNAGTTGIIIKASATLPNGTLKFRSGSPYGTVEMYSKANWDLTRTTPNTKYAWQYFGIPLKTLSYSNSFSNCFVREWDESVTDYFKLWVQRNDGSSLTLGAGSTLTSGKGYELVQQYPKIYSFAGQLETSNLDKQMPYSTDAAYPGQHIFANPYTAAINIESIVFGANTEKSLYLYNTGTFADWSIGGGETSPGSGPGQYTVATPLAAGGNGVPSQIPSMQAFLVKATNSAGGSIYIPFSTGLVTNTTQQRIVSLNDSSVTNKISTRIDITSARFSDRMWIFTSADCTRKFDNGWDGPKMLGSNQITQLFSIEEDGNYQINAVKDMNDTYIAFQAGEDREFKLKFNHENIDLNYSRVYLVDLVENKTIDITVSGSEYSFTSEQSSAPIKRFKIITKPNDIQPIDKVEYFKIFNKSNAIFIQNFLNKPGNLSLYNSAGAAVKRVTFEENTITPISTTNLSKGVYLVKAVVDNEEITQRIIIR